MSSKITRSNYKTLESCLKKYATLLVTQKALQRQLQEIASLKKKLENTMHPIAPTDESVVSVAGTVFSIYVDCEDLYIKVLPQVTIVDEDAQAASEEDILFET